LFPSSLLNTEDISSSAYLPS